MRHPEGSTPGPVVRPFFSVSYRIPCTYKDSRYLPVPFNIIRFIETINASLPEKDQFGIIR